jgi:aminoglycoside/choline kinase family phosphotransferase
MTLPLSKDSTDTRLELLKAWLNAHAARYALELDTLAPASSDASFRRYFRLAGKAKAPAP